MSQPTAELFIDYNNVTGEPYLGIEYSGGGVSVRMYLCGKATAREIEQNVSGAVKDLLSLTPKIIGASNASLRQS